MAKIAKNKAQIMVIVNIFGPDNIRD